jgi:hypothetical protein
MRPSAPPGIHSGDLCGASHQSRQGEKPIICSDVEHISANQSTLIRYTHGSPHLELDVFVWMGSIYSPTIRQGHAVPPNLRMIGVFHQTNISILEERVL